MTVQHSQSATSLAVTTGSVAGATAGTGSAHAFELLTTLQALGITWASLFVALVSAALALLIARSRGSTAVSATVLGTWLWGAFGAPALTVAMGWHPGWAILMSCAGSLIVPMVVLDPWGTISRATDALSRFLPWVRQRDADPPSPTPAPPGAGTNTTK